MEPEHKKTIIDIGRTLQILLAVIMIITIMMVAPLRSEIDKLCDAIENIERERIPEIEAQLREQRIRNKSIENSLTEIKSHLEHIRRRLEVE